MSEFEKPDGLEASGEDKANTDKPKRNRNRNTSRSKKGDVFTADDCAAKIFQVYNLTAKMLGTTLRHKEKDFAEEGAALSRLTEKYPIVSAAMKILDPLFFLLGTFNKFNVHFSEFGARKKAEREQRKREQAGGQVSYEIDQNSTAQL